MFKEMQLMPFYLILSDVDVPHPDEKSIITYVSSLYDVMPRVDVHDGLRANVSTLIYQNDGSGLIKSRTLWILR